MWPLYALSAKWKNMNSQSFLSVQSICLIKAPVAKLSIRFANEEANRRYGTQDNSLIEDLSEQLQKPDAFTYVCVFQQIYNPAVFTLFCCTSLSSWNQVHMTEHNIHSHNYPHRDDVTCLFNLVWTQTRLIPSLVFHQRRPESEPLFHYAQPLHDGMYSKPIKGTDWWPTGDQTSTAVLEHMLRSFTWIKAKQF